MKIKNILILIVFVGIFIWLGFSQNKKTTPTVLSFEDCVKAGYLVMESFPRQCKTPDGRTYAEELPVEATYFNASSDLIVVDLPFPGAVTGKEFTVTGSVVF
jgi:hypothetical protein